MINKITKENILNFTIIDLKKELANVTKELSEVKNKLMKVILISDSESLSKKYSELLEYESFLKNEINNNKNLISSQKVSKLSTKEED